MYALFLNSTKVDNHRGFFVGLTIHRGKEYEDRYNGKQRVEPRLTFDESKVKLWKTKSAAIKYADTLASRLETIQHRQYVTKPYLHCMKYQIDVLDIDSKTQVYSIKHYSFESDR